MRRRGFTLIELLVVIAIIAILAAILFPVFAQAREKARQSMCASNTRQVALAATMYVQDYDETFPGGPGVASLWYPGPLGSWTNLPTNAYGNVAAINVGGRLVPYIKNVGCFVDPNDPNGDRFASGRWDSRYTRLSFWWHAGISQGFSWPTYGFSGSNKPSNAPYTLAAMARPAEVQLVQDNWAAYHSAGTQGQARWNISYADGHVKFSQYVDAWVSSKNQPWYWNYYNPGQGVNVERACQPDCMTAAKQ